MRGMKDKYYTTKHIAEQAGIHVNTVRFYESIGFLTPPERDKNGYRMFTALHVDECKLIRTAMHAEVLQNGLRKKCIEIVKLCAELDFENALNSANEYYEMIQNEIILAKHAVEYVKKISNATSCDNCNSYKRKETAQLLNVTVDALRNWEMNGFIKIKHSENGYRYYTETDIRRLKIIPYPCFRKLKADSFIQKKTLLSESCCSFSAYLLLCAFPQDFWQLYL